MDINDFKKKIEESGHETVALGLQEKTNECRTLAKDNFIFFDTTLQYLVNMISAAVGKYTALGGRIAEGAYNVRYIGRALNEDIYFPGILLLWANVLEINVNELDIDIRKVKPEEKESGNSDLKMRDVGAKVDAVFFQESYELAKSDIIDKFGDGWFTNWPETFRFAYILRNALAHNGCWEIQERRGREHYQHEIFEWPRAGLKIQMRDIDGVAIDEGRNVLDDLSGADFVVLLIEMDEALKK
jgi:hypothetical protein